MRRISILVTAIGLVLLSSLLMSQTGKSAGSPKTSNSLQASMDRGKKVYSERCLTCHQADGGGVQNMNPPLIKTKWVLGDKTTLIQILLKGLQGEIEIEGDTYHNVMGSHADLSDQQIADVLTYVRNSFGNKAKSVSASDVKAVRAKTK
jgi:mono/diheme cytochrome c family protein